MKKNNLLFLLLITIVAPMTMLAQNELTGSGSQNDPYMINSDSDWETLSTNVKAGNSFSG